MNTLAEHYDAKYAAESADRVGLIRLTQHPRDRFEAVVKLAWPGGDTLLEVGAGSGSVLRTVRPRYRSCVATQLAHEPGEAVAQNVGMLVAQELARELFRAHTRFGHRGAPLIELCNAFDDRQTHGGLSAPRASLHITGLNYSALEPAC